MQDLKWLNMKSEQLEVNDVGNLGVARKKKLKGQNDGVVIKTLHWWTDVLLDLGYGTRLLEQR